MLRKRTAWLILPWPLALAGCALLASSEFEDLQGEPGVDGSAPNDSFVPTSEAACGTECIDSSGTVSADGSGTEAGDASTTDSGPNGPTTLTFQRSDGGPAVADTMLLQGFPSNNYGTTTNLQLDYGVSSFDAGGSAVVLMRFDLASIPPGKRVSSATLTLNVTDGSGGVTPFDIHALVRPWSEMEATWTLASTGNPWMGNQSGTRNDAGTTDRSPTPFASFKPAAAGSFDIVLNATGIAVIQKWIDDPSTNFGFVFDTANNSDGILFTSSESTQPPKLVVTLAAPDGG